MRLTWTSKYNKDRYIMKTFKEYKEEGFINESKVSFEKMSFTVITSNDSRGTYIQFIPDSKTLDFTKNEQLEAISKMIKKKLPEFVDILNYEIAKPAAGLSFQIDTYKLNDLLAKRLK
jgi:DNA gyrase/topoisomerase IV subunit B